ncbi:delta-aminolevulinic acid dehydratase, putative porphobilinogen synthase, putative [Plasmodium vinckei lentum]|uniref:Delta-aminolevulinic acid dehydratase n=1 Tax=Plasmodium vinckei lentum TaxID=138297 RepID=A0A6V7SL52_PLAVN|nr:delta-aminolevulinic acid dehydratase, putative porphobilinogen synthase, putative [Plasmodium vinckei lentum]
MKKINEIILSFLFALHFVYCLKSNFRKTAYILHSPNWTNDSKTRFRRWNSQQNNNNSSNLIEDNKSIEDLYNEQVSSQNALKNFSKDIHGNIYIDTNRRERRIKRNKHLLALYNNNNIKASNFIYPLFIHEEDIEKKETKLEGIYTFNFEGIVKEIEECLRLNIHHFMFFPVVREENKSVYCEESYNENSYFCKTITKIKDKFLNDVIIYADVALDPYNIYGHDGIYDNKNQEIINDISVHTLVKQSLCLAKSGADVLCPSDSMDNRIELIRKNLDYCNFRNVLILSYTCKYASTLYKPFRYILSANISKNFIKNKQSYQHNFNNYIDLNNVDKHIKEGADIIMVKPSLFYLDVIREIKKRIGENINVPIAVYNVSGEYMMIKSYVKYLNENENYENEILTELFKSYLRAGANIIITYFAKQYGLYIKNLYEKKINIEDNNSNNFNVQDLYQDDDLIKCELPNKLSSIIYKKRKNKNKKMYILNNEDHVILPSNPISEEYKHCINPIDFNYEELHVYMEVNTGSVNEKKNQQGISHLCEHVSYMGSKKRKDIIDKNIRTNAYTDFHHIVFYISVSLNNEIYKENALSDFKYDNFVKNIKEDDIENYDVYTVDEFNYKHSILSQCLDVMVDVLSGRDQFNKERITKEKKAIFSEYSIINTVEYKINSDIIKTLHRENRLSHRLPIGKLELLKRYEEKDVKEYFNLFFRPENVNLYVYGDVNADIAQKIINKKFNNIKCTDLKKTDIEYLNILNDKNTLRSKNKNLPAVVHMYGATPKNTSNAISYDNLIDTHNNNQQNSCNDKEVPQLILEDTPKMDELIDDNIADLIKFKNLKKENKNDIATELKFRSYLQNKYSVNLEEEKSLNKPLENNFKTQFEIFKYSLNNANINILLKEEIKSIRSMEDFKISIIKDIIFYCLSFRFNIHRNDLFNNIDINEYTNINEGATIRTIEIKTNPQSIHKSINGLYKFIKSLIIYGFSKGEIENYKINEIDFDNIDDQNAEKNNTTDTTHNSNDSEKGTSSTSQNMKLGHPETCNEQNDEYILDTKMNEIYTDEIQKIIDYNSCNNVYMNEKSEKKLKKHIFENITTEEINNFAKNYFQYLFNIFNEDTSLKPNCVIIHVPNANFNDLNKNDIKEYFYNNIYSDEQIPNYSINIQKQLLSPQYIYQNITQNLYKSKYIDLIHQKQKDSSIFSYILKQIKQVEKPHEIYNTNCILKNLNTEPNFDLFKECYNITHNNNKKIDPINELNNNEFPKSSNTNNIGQDVEIANENSHEDVKLLNLKNYVLSNKGKKEIENYQLLNGIKINLYKTQIDKKYVYLRLIIPHNDILRKKSSKLQNKTSSFDLLFSIICLFEGGEIENISRENVEIHCSNKSINIYIDINDEYFYIDIYTYNKYENINSAFSILNNIILQTKIEPSSLPRVVDKLKKDFFEYKNNLQSFLLGQTIYYLSDGAIGNQNFDIQDVEKITFETVQNVLNNLFNDLSLFELTIVGDISNVIHYYILHYLGTLKNRNIEAYKNIKETEQLKNIMPLEKNAPLQQSTPNNNFETTHISNDLTKRKSENENDLLDEYNLLCPFKNYEDKLKDDTYVYIKEKEEHAVFLLIGKSANHFGFLPNGVHISLYLIQYLKKLLHYKENEHQKKTDDEKNNKNLDTTMIDSELESISKHINLKDYEGESFQEIINNKAKLYTNPLFFSIVSYIIQYILNSKFFHHLREKKELTYDSSFEFINYEKYFAGFFTLLVQTNPQDLNRVKKEVLSAFHEFTKNYYNYSDYLIHNAKLSYLNKKNKDLKYFIDKISGMMLTHFPLKYKNKDLLKDNIILNKIQKIDILLVLFILFNQKKNYHISYGISAPENLWTNLYKNINKLG